jgi:tryptophanyl-tRNA synthetase
MGWGQFKPLLADTAVAHLAPIQAKFDELMGDRAYLESILKAGREKAGALANATLVNVQAALGFSKPL